MAKAAENQDDDDDKLDDTKAGGDQDDTIAPADDDEIDDDEDGSDPGDDDDDAGDPADDDDAGDDDDADEDRLDDDGGKPRKKGKKKPADQAAGAAEDPDIVEMQTSLDAAIKEYGADDPIVKTMQQNLKLHRKREAESAETRDVVAERKTERAWTDFKKRAGIEKPPKHLRKKLSTEALQTFMRENVQAILKDGTTDDPTTARIIATDRLKNRVKKILRTPKPVDDKQDKRRSQGEQHRNRRGATLTPSGGAAGGGARQRETSPEDEFAANVRKAGGGFYDPSDG